MPTTQERADAGTSKPSTEASRMTIDEEALPIYEGIQRKEDDEEAMPPPSATPEEVRSWLSSMLATKRRLEADRVSGIVSKWTVGSGRELRRWEPQMFFDIFGREDGWVVFYESRSQMLYEEDKEQSVERPPLALVISMSILSVTLILICIVFYERIWLIYQFFASIVIGITALLVFCEIRMYREKPNNGETHESWKERTRKAAEEKAEQLLVEAVKPPIPPRLIFY